MGANIMNSLARTMEDFSEVKRSKDQQTKSQWVGVILPSEASKWQIDAVRSVVEISELQHNWDTYGGPPPSLEAVKASKKLIWGIRLDGPTLPNIVPSVGGGIQFEWSSAFRELELEVLPDGSFEYLRVEEGNILDDGPILTSGTAIQQDLIDWFYSG